MADTSRSAVRDVSKAAQEAFWEVVARSYPKATTGDFPPDATVRFDQIATAAVDVWVNANVPKTTHKVLESNPIEIACAYIKEPSVNEVMENGASHHYAAVYQVFATEPGEKYERPTGWWGYMLRDAEDGKPFGFQHDRDEPTFASFEEFSEAMIAAYKQAGGEI